MANLRLRIVARILPVLPALTLAALAFAMPGLTFCHDTRGAQWIGGYC